MLVSVNGVTYKVYTLTEFAEKCGLSRNTLLHYEKIGRLPPSNMRDGKNRRLYTEELVREVSKIFRGIRQGTTPDPELYITIKQKFKDEAKRLTETS